MNPQMMNSLVGKHGPAGQTAMGNSAGQRSRSSGDIIPKGYSKGQIQNFTPEQMQMLQQLIGMVGPDSQIAQMAGGNANWDEIEAPAWRQFQEAQGQLGSRFSGMGMGAQRGSGFKNQAGQLGSDFAMNLASQRQGLTRQALNDLMSMSNMLMGQRPQDKFLIEKPQKQQEQGGFWNSVLPMVGTAAGSFFAGPAGGAAGGAAGSFLSNLFGGGMQSGSISNR